MVDNTAPPSPQKITGQLVSVFPSAALLGALQLELFTALGDDALTGEEIARAMGVQPRRLLPILNVLVLIGLLQRHGDRFVNAEESTYYLIKGRPNYIGGITSCTRTYTVRPSQRRHQFAMIGQPRNTTSGR